MNYASLVANIKSFTENEESAFVAAIDTFIELAELRVLREADLNVTRKYATATLSANDTFLSLPSDCVVIRAMQTISGNDRVFLQQKDPSFLNEYIGDRTTTGTPRYYAHHDHDTASVVPASADDITIELSYTYRPTGLSGSNTTSWIGDNAPDVLLYACLVEAYIFMKGEQGLLQIYQSKYDRALQALVMEENLRNRTDEYTTRSIKVGGQ